MNRANNTKSCEKMESKKKLYTAYQVKESAGHYQTYVAIDDGSKIENPSSLTIDTKFAADILSHIIKDGRKYGKKYPFITLETTDFLLSKYKENNTLFENSKNDLIKKIHSRIAVHRSILFQVRSTNDISNELKNRLKFVIKKAVIEYTNQVDNIHQQIVLWRKEFKDIVENDPNSKVMEKGESKLRSDKIYQLERQLKQKDAKIAEQENIIGELRRKIEKIRPNKSYDDTYNPSGLTTPTKPLVEYTEENRCKEDGLLYSAIEFVHRTYGDHMRALVFTSGDLQRIDKPLFRKVRKEADEQGKKVEEVMLSKREQLIRIVEHFDQSDISIDDLPCREATRIRMAKTRIAMEKNKRRPNFLGTFGK